MYLCVLVSVFFVQGVLKGQLGVQHLVDRDCSVTDIFCNYLPKKSELWWASYSLADGVGDIQIEKCCTCLLFKGLDCAIAQPAGTSAS